MRRLATLTIALVLTGSGLIAPDAVRGADAAAPRVQPLPAGVSVHQLDNGLQVVLIENKALPMIGVNVAVKVGSAYENFSTSGMSHMLEHLLFNGTTRRTQKQLYDDVDKIGGYSNANTNYFSTNYMMVTPVAKIEQGMDIQSDMLLNSIMPPEKYKKEKGIVLEEIAISINRPTTQVERNFNSILYPGHALSMPVLGTYETIKKNELDNVVAYYRNFYVPNNMVLSVVGNFDSASMLELVERYYGHAKPGRVVYEESDNWRTGMQPLRAGVEIPSLSHRFYNGEKTRLQIVYALNGQEPATYFALLDAAAESLERRISEDMREEFPEAIELVTISTLPSPVQSYLKVDVTLEDDSQLTSISSWLHEALATSRFSVTKEEASAMGTRRALAFLLDLEKPHMFGIMNSETFATSGIDEVLAGFAEPDLSAEIRTVNATRLTEPVTIVQHPAQAPDDSAQRVANVDVLHQDPDTGLALTVRQNPGSKLLAVHILMKHKSALESMYGEDVAWVLHDMLGRQLEEYFGKPPASRYGIKLKVNDNDQLPMDDIYLHRDFGYVRAEAIARDVPDALTRLVTQIQEFEPDEADFQESLRALEQHRIVTRRVRSQSLFTDTYKEQIYAPRIYPASTEAPTFEQLREFRQLYLAPGNLILSVVSPASVERVIETVDASVRAGTSVPAGDYRVDDLRLNSNASPVDIDLEAGGKQSFLFWGYTKSVAEEDVAPLEILSLMLRNRIVFDVREKQGLAYRMNVGVKVHGDRALISLNMGTRPENIATLLPQMEMLFSADYLDEAINQDNVGLLINKHLGRMSFQRLSSVNQGYYAAHSLYFFESVDYDSDLLERLAAVTVADVRRVAGEYLQQENPWRIVVH